MKQKKKQAAAADGRIGTTKLTDAVLNGLHLGQKCKKQAKMKCFFLCSELVFAATVRVRPDYSNP